MCEVTARWNSPIRRISAAAVGSAAALFGLWVCVIAGIYTSAFQRPDPNPALDGDPCCFYPDNWGEVLIGSIYFIAILSAGLGLLAAGSALSKFGATGRLPRYARTRTARWLGAFSLFCAVSVPLSWVVIGLLAD